jgi:ClpP class serine protease
MLWLLEDSAYSTINNIYNSGVMPTAEQQIDYESRYSALDSQATSRLLTVSGNNAEVAIQGVMTKAPSFLAMLFGGSNTTYQEITNALNEAEADSKIESITLKIDSPGGQFDGLFDVLAAIQMINKPVKAFVSNVSASAAYAIASQADEIVASNRAARIGSIGVAATIDVNDSQVTITSTEAQKKRPDVTTVEGKAMVREELDAMHDIFVDAIAKGRNLTKKEINANFGQGATLLAEEALKRGMIDSIGETSLKLVESTKTTTAHSGGKQPETKGMNLKELKSQHPDVYSAAVEEGVNQERDRVTAHLTMGEASGDTQTAFEAIKNGSKMTNTLQAKYMTAGMNRNDVTKRQDDDKQADAGDKATLSNAQDDGNEVVRLVEARLGVGG